MFDIKDVATVTAGAAANADAKPFRCNGLVAPPFACLDESTSYL